MESAVKIFRFFEKNRLHRQPSCLISRGFMRKTPRLFPAIIVTAACLILGGTLASAQTVESAKSRFVFTGPDGKTDSADVITKFIPKKIVRPFARSDSSIDPKL